MAALLSSSTIMSPPTGENIIPRAEETTTIYCCRRCGTFLFTAAELAFHEPKKHEFSWKKRRKQTETSTHFNSSIKSTPVSTTHMHNSNDVTNPSYNGTHESSIDSSVCAVLFLEDCPSWLPAVEGKVHCPKCSTRVGSFSWSGSQCSCGTWVTPAIAFQRARIDMKQRSQDIVNAMAMKMGSLSVIEGLTTNEELVDGASFHESIGIEEETVHTNMNAKKGDGGAKSTSSGSLQEAVSELTEMGFEEPLVRIALKRNGNDVASAMSWLFSPSALGALDVDGELIS